MSAAVKCQHCQDSGMSPGSAYLDCTRCGAAVERVVFEAELPRRMRRNSELSELWTAYQMGKAAGAAESAWMDIATAPLDGTRIRLLCELGEDVGYFCVPLNTAGGTVSWRGTVGEWSTELGNGEPLKWQGIAGAAQAMPAWQPIETAPKDGTNVLLINRKGNMAAGLWQVGPFRELGGWWLRGGNAPDVFFNDHHGPTHWMTLPAAPKP